MLKTGILAAMICALCALASAPAQAQGSGPSKNGPDMVQAGTVTTDSIKNMIEVARAAQLAGDLETAKQLYETAINDSHRIDSFAQAAEAAAELMLCRLQLGDIAGAEQAGAMGISALEQDGSYCEAGSLASTLGSIMRSAGEHGKAREHYERALQMFVLGDDKPAIAGAHIALAVLCDMLGDLECALTQYGNARNIYHQIGDHLNEALCFNNEAYTMRRMGDLEGCIVAYQNSLFLYERLGLSEQQAETHNSLGWTYSQLKDWDAALNDYELALDLLNGGSDLRMLAECHQGLGRVLYRMDRPEDAITHFAAAWDKAFGRKDIAVLNSLINDMAPVFSSLGDTESLDAYRDALTALSGEDGDHGNPAGY